MIELYIENKKIDITDDLEINFTYESIDPDKLSSIKNSFSKTVNIPGTSNNNIVFGHIFRYDKYIPIAGPSNIESFYDPHKKVEWFINKNGNLVNRGYCTLDNIIVKGEVDITYQLTLYGGIGEFFYSLSYNSDGSEKTLKDLYWNWYPRLNILEHGTATTPEDEDSRILYKGIASIVAESYHNLNPYYTYSGTTDIEKDIVFVPSYTGLYNDFDSKHMLVSTFNQYSHSSPSPISDNTLAKLNESFPDDYYEFIDSGEDPDDPSDDNYKTYTTIDENLDTSGGYRYGLATFSRDLDPWEAGDIRVNEMPIAVRLSKLMNVISQSINNGGYEVIWDDDILNSYQWLYSWILLGKLKQETDEQKLLELYPSEDYDGQKTTINVDFLNGDGQLINNTTTYNIPSNTTSLNAGNYKLNLNVIPKLEFRCDSFNYWKDRTSGYISGSMYDNLGSNYKYIWTTPVLIHKIYSGNTLIKTVADIFYFSSNPEKYFFGYNKIGNNYLNITSLRNIKQVLEQKITQRFMNSGETIDYFNYHNCKIKDPEIIELGYINTVKFECLNTSIPINFNIDTNISDFRVSQSQGVMWTMIKPNPTAEISSGLYGTDNINFNVITNGSSSGPSGNPLSIEAPYGFINGDHHTIWPYNEFSSITDQNYSSAYFNINENLFNGIMNYSSIGYKVLNLDKNLLFSNTSSPMKYLTDFCKIMNFKFICNNTEKKIYIKYLKNYYKDNIISLDGKVDIGRDINIKNITTNYKSIKVDLNTPETYPVKIFNRLSKYKFNTYKYDTGIKYNILENNLLDNSIYDNLIDWQQNSIYYNNYSQFPKPYNNKTISWTLFNTENNKVETKEIITPGIDIIGNNLLETLDTFPKISLFNEENKYIDINSSLIYLNGFTKNYNYSSVDKTYTFTLEPDEIIDNSIISNDDAGTIYPDENMCIYVYRNIDPTKTYNFTASFNFSKPGYYIINQCNESDTVIKYDFDINTESYTDRSIVINSNTKTIKCNFSKSDTTKKLTITSDYYSISPKVSFSNDTLAQYTINGKRCYLYDFKYSNDIFTSWGYWSSGIKSSASSWVLPVFSRDLYNIYSQDDNNWYFSGNLVSSWNISSQEELSNIINITNTPFIKNTSFNYPKFSYYINLVNSNIYSIDNYPINNDTRVINLYWENYLNDLYDRNTRDITAYVDLSGLGDANMIMRNIYSWRSHLWIITRLENFKISETTNDKFTKVRLHKIKDINTWVNGE